MSAFFDDHPWLMVAAIFGALIGSGALVLVLSAAASRFLPRRSPVPLLLGAASIVGAIAAASLGGFDDRTVGWIVAVFGGGGLVLAAASIWRDDERADDMGMRLERSFLRTELAADGGGLSTRLTTSGRVGEPDRLLVQADAASLGRVRAAARRVPPPMSAMERLANADLAELFSARGVEWRLLAPASRPASWIGWEVRGAPPAEAAAVLGRAPSPDRVYKGSLRLVQVGVRDGRVRCLFEGRWVGPAELLEAKEAARDFAAYLRGERRTEPA